MYLLFSAAPAGCPWTCSGCGTSTLRTTPTDVSRTTIPRNALFVTCFGRKCFGNSSNTVGTALSTRHLLLPIVQNWSQVKCLEHSLSLAVGAQFNQRMFRTHSTRRVASRKGNLQNKNEHYWFDSEWDGKAFSYLWNETPGSFTSRLLLQP